MGEWEGDWVFVCVRVEGVMHKITEILMTADPRWPLLIKGKPVMTQTSEALLSGAQ